MIKYKMPFASTRSDDRIFLSFGAHFEISAIGMTVILYFLLRKYFFGWDAVFDWTGIALLDFVIEAFLHQEFNLLGVILIAIIVMYLSVIHNLEFDRSRDLFRHSFSSAFHSGSSTRHISEIQSITIPRQRLFLPAAPHIVFESNAIPLEGRHFVRRNVDHIRTLANAIDVPLIEK